MVTEIWSGKNKCFFCEIAIMGFCTFYILKSSVPGISNSNFVRTSNVWCTVLCPLLGKTPCFFSSLTSGKSHLKNVVVVWVVLSVFSKQWFCILHSICLLPPVKIGFFFPNFHYFWEFLVLRTRKPVYTSKSVLFPQMNECASLEKLMCAASYMERELCFICNLCNCIEKLL